MNKKLKKFLGAVGIILFMCVFLWSSNVHSFLDETFWHSSKILSQPSPFALLYLLVVVPFGWIISFFIAAIPFFMLAAVIEFFNYKEQRLDLDKEEKQKQLIDAQKACNLYINTNVSASTKPHIDF